MDLFIGKIVVLCCFVFGGLCATVTPPFSDICNEESLESYAWNATLPGSTISQPCLSPYNSGNVYRTCNNGTWAEPLYYNCAKLIKADRNIIYLIQYVSCGLTILCVVLTILLYVFSTGNMGSSTTALVISLCLCVMASNIAFVAGINNTTAQLLCKITSICLHYLPTVVEFHTLAIIFHLTTLKFQTSRYYFLLLLVAAWGIPAIIVGLFGYFTELEYYGNTTNCWIAFDRYNVLFWLYIGVILSVQLLLYLSVCGVIYRYRLPGRGPKRSSSVGTCAVFCVYLFTLMTWLSGVLSVNEYIDSLYTTVIVFAVFNILQGISIFIVLGIQATRPRKEKVPDYYRTRQSVPTITTFADYKDDQVRSWSYDQYLHSRQKSEPDDTVDFYSTDEKEQENYLAQRRLEREQDLLQCIQITSSVLDRDVPNPDNENNISNINDPSISNRSSPMIILHNAENSKKVQNANFYAPEDISDDEELVSIHSRINNIDPPAPSRISVTESDIVPFTVDIIADARQPSRGGESEINSVESKSTEIIASGFVADVVDDAVDEKAGDKVEEEAGDVGNDNSNVNKNEFLTAIHITETIEDNEPENDFSVNEAEESDSESMIIHPNASNANLAQIANEMDPGPFIKPLHIESPQHVTNEINEEEDIQQNNKTAGFNETHESISHETDVRRNTELDPPHNHTHNTNLTESIALGSTDIGYIEVEKKTTTELLPNDIEVDPTLDDMPLPPSPQTETHIEHPHPSDEDHYYTEIQDYVNSQRTEIPKTPDISELRNKLKDVKRRPELAAEIRVDNLNSSILTQLRNNLKPVSRHPAQQITKPEFPPPPQDVPTLQVPPRPPTPPSPFTPPVHPPYPIAVGHGETKRVGFAEHTTDIP